MLTGDDGRNGTPVNDSGFDVVASARRALAALGGDSQELGRERFASGGVLTLALRGDRLISAQVKSERPGRRFIVHGAVDRPLFCTCAWGRACKHVAAVLYALVAGRAMHAGPAPAPTTPVRDEAWRARRWAQSLGPLPPLSNDERVVFVLDPRPIAKLSLAAQKLLVSGRLGNVRRLGRERVQAVIDGRAGDADTLAAVTSIPWAADGALRLRGRLGGRALADAFESGRLYADDGAGPRSVEAGATIAGRLGWRPIGRSQRPVIEVDREVEIIGVTPLAYWDSERACIGRVDVPGVSEAISIAWLEGPSIDERDLGTIARELEGKRVPVPVTVKWETIGGKPTGVLTLREVAGPDGPERFGELAFRYGDVLVSGEQRVVRPSPSRHVTVTRNASDEAAIRARLYDYGFFSPYRLDGGSRWLLRGVQEGLELLMDGHRKLGGPDLEVVVDPSLSLTILEDEDWFADIESTETDWFELDLGIVVGGERVSLLPALLSVFRAPPAEGAPIFAPLADGRYVLVPRERIEPLAALLTELAAEPEGKGQRRLSRLRAMDIAAVLRAEQGTAAALRKLRDELASAPSLGALRLPRTFRAELRPYQAAGVRWLDRLRKAGLGAVLADDMGLGKTVQALALLALASKAKGEKLPSLVVAPTSVLLSWQEQTARFAPSLRVVLWHGADRGRQRAQIPDADLVLTSYALVVRDREELVTSRRWSTVVLDEAQAIKNAKTALATAVREFTARQRIVLTGTPMENHLGELHSIVSFAVPGALGSDRAFRAAYRVPIERARATGPLESLRRRLAPVLLRRTKEQVASDLPEKTTIDHVVELEGPQRDIYEAVRQLMVKAVRDEIKKKGFARSKIIVLDALLKLRQVCCDPRLLKAAAAKRGAKSAKLEAFAEIVETLVKEGRRMLVFSQFTSMLGLIGERLDAMRIPYVTLTGATRDRGAVVDMFRRGTMPVFLISLKAGGTGLNIVEADTVIHYDPWWNPAVEAQATDRVHRIGQTKPVFVYRLLTRDTVEQKIVELQTKKASLARGLLDGTFELPQLDEATIDALLAPLPE